MNYSTLFKSFKTELSKVIQYKRVGSPFNAFAIVATIPFWILWGVTVFAQSVLLFVFKCVASSNDYLESWVNDSKKDIKPLTEAVLYFVTMPFIFLNKIVLSLFSIAFYLVWFFSTCYAYIATLGGIRWQPFISDADYESDINIKATTNKIAGGVIVTIGFSFFCLWVLLYIIARIAGDYDILKVANVFDWIYTLYMVIAIPITFKKSVSNNGAAKLEETNENSDVEAEDFEEELEF